MAHLEFYVTTTPTTTNTACLNKHSGTVRHHLDIQRPIVTTISHGNVAYSSSNQTPAFVLATLSVFINSSFATYIILAYAVFYVLDFQLPNVACFTKLSLKKVTTTTTTKRYQTQSMQAVVTGSQCGTVSQT